MPHRLCLCNSFYSITSLIADIFRFHDNEYKLKIGGEPGTKLEHLCRCRVKAFLYGSEFYLVSKYFLVYLFLLIISINSGTEAMNFSGFFLTSRKRSSSLNQATCSISSFCRVKSLASLSINP